MRYLTLREVAKDGDILLHAGTSLGARIVRVMTGSQYSHIALLIWQDGGLWVSEMKTNGGYTMTPASQRISEMAETGVVRYGRAPDSLDREAMRDVIMTFRDGYVDNTRDPNYSWWTLITVWISQMINRPMPKRYVCSTYVQCVWAAGGLTLERTADPEDFARHIDNLARIDP